MINGYVKSQILGSVIIKRDSFVFLFLQYHDSIKLKVKKKNFG